MRDTPDKKNMSSKGHSSCGMSRRKFLAGCAACAGTAGVMGATSRLRPSPAAGKVKIRILYSLHGVIQEKPDWPNKGFDFGPVMERVNAELARRLPDFAFLPSPAGGPEEAQKIIDADKGPAVDGYLVCQMNCWNKVVQGAAASGKPVLYADYQFAGSGGFLVYNAALLRSGARNVGFVASSRIEDLAEAVRCFEAAKAAGADFDFSAATSRVRLSRTAKPGSLACKPDDFQSPPPEETVRRLNASKILAVRGPDPEPSVAVMGIPIVYLPFSELNQAWEAADREEAAAVAERWTRSAALVEGVSRAEIENSAAMYLGQKALLKKHGANAVTVNCLGGFYGDHIHAYPCLGFFELLNEGLVGACECDVPSTVSMLALATMSRGRPGYISDPVMETSTRRIIYAHCVASNRVFGPSGPANPYQILTHSEDRQGASVRSILPPGYMTTTIEISDARKEILFHRAKAVGNDPDDRACRTKLVAEPVGDFEKLFAMWDKWGWHRVTVYGDLKDEVSGLADALGWTVIEEA